MLAPIAISLISTALTACVIDSGNHRDVTAMNPTPTGNTAANLNNASASNNSITNSNVAETSNLNATSSSANTRPTLSMDDILDHAMDENDRTKMSHALSANQPIHWVNSATNKSYSLVPSGNTSIKGNDECRKFYITVTSNGEQQRAYGTACLAQDDTWQPIRGHS